MLNLPINKNHRIARKGRTTRPPKKSGQWIRKEKRRAIYLLDGCKCRLCGKSEIELKKAGTCLSLDHLILWSDFGSNKVCNLLTLCMVCNNKRKDTKLNEFLVGKSETFIKEIINRLNFQERDITSLKVASKFWIANGEDLNNYPSI